jgi:hypothetical protein
LKCKVKLQPHTPKQAPPPGIIARPRETRLKACAVVKREMSEIFEDVYDAWVFMDTNRSLSIGPSALAKGLERLDIKVNLKELVLELDKDFYDGQISVREFIKGELLSVSSGVFDILMCLKLLIRMLV